LLRLSFRGSPSAKRFRYAHFPERPSDLAAAEAPSNTPPAEVVLRDARKRFDTATVLDGCTLRLSPQEFEFLLTDGSTATVRAGEDRFPALALIGPNGAGKTTLLNVLCGYVPLDSGGLTAGGAPVTAPVPNPVLGRSFQQPQLFDGLTVGEHLLVGAMRGMRGRKNLRSAARVPELRQQAMSVAERLELTPDLNRLVSELSYGRRKFVDIAVTIASRPGMLILDEPTAGVSPREITLLVDAICDLARSMPILMVEHNLDVVRRLDFTAVFMADGALIAHGELADVLSRQDVRQLFTGHRIGQVES
jgi:branched-chain amino acid transport system ATP-binding protein